MFKHTKQLAYKVRVDEPNPLFAKMLQQAIGGVEGEIRVCLQYLFQGWGNRGPDRYKDAGLAATPADSNGNPFNGSWVVATGNLGSDMLANVHAEASGRLLATRLYEMTDDPGMKDMLSFLIARDTMHQNQWMAVLEEQKDMGMPVPPDFPQEQEKQEFAYEFFVHSDGEVPENARWTSGPSVDSKGEFSVRQAEPMGEVPELAPAEARPELHSIPIPAAGGLLRKAKDAITP